MGGDRTAVRVAQGPGAVVRVAQGKRARTTHGRDVEIAIAAVRRSGSC
jgi:hypothetical protein